MTQVYYTFKKAGLLLDKCDCLINERKKYVGKYNSSWFGKLRRTNKVIKVGKIIENMTS